MRKLLLIAGLAALALPAAALAKDQDPNMKPDAGPPDATAPVDGGAPADAGDHAADVAYSGAPDDLMAREAWFDHQIRRNQESGIISDYDAQHDRQLLDGVRRHQDELQADHGDLTADDRADLNTQLDGLRARLDVQLGQVR
jgi:hypothetical protein